FSIEPEVLARTLFPLGDLNKREVRERARELDLPVADKPESQEICFVPAGGYAAFVTQRAPEAPGGTGHIIDSTGTVLATHDGVHRFTVGQRRGLGISGDAPLYVTKIDAATGTVHVGPRAATLAVGLVATQANWLSRTPATGAQLEVKIRSRF